MKKPSMMASATLLALALCGRARAESFASKLGESVVTASDGSAATTEETPPVDNAERQVLQAEATDAADGALANARSEQNDGGAR